MKQENQMPANPHRHFIVNQQLVPSLINGLINGAIAWAIYHASAHVGLWDDGAYAHDLLATGLLLPAISWPILRSILSHQIATGKMPVLDGVPTPWLARFMPRTLWGGGAVIALAGLFFGAASVAAMQLSGAPAFDGNGYALLKSVYAAALTFALQPVMIFAALGTTAKADAVNATGKARQ